MKAGLTGGIGSGKTIVARFLEILGCAVFYSDEVARGLYFEEPIRQKVITLLGKDAYLNDSQINKAYISRRIFSDKASLTALNSILHPAVQEKFLQFAGRHPNQVVIKESALLFEAGLTANCDQIIVVAAPEELRIKRVMARDKLSYDEVLKKIRSQMPQEEKIRAADHVILNDDRELLLPQILEVHKALAARN